MSSPGRGRQAGFSYIEILIAIAVLAAVAGGLAMGLDHTTGALGNSKVDSTAAKLAQGVLDSAHRMPYEDVGLTDGSPPGKLPAQQTRTVEGISYDIATDVEYVDDPALGQPRTYVNYKKVSVTVTPQGGSAPRAVTQSTLIAPPSIGAIAGKATVLVTVIDAMTDQPVANAPVTVYGSTSPSQTRSTGSDGKVIFAGLEPSAISETDPRYRYRVKVDLGDPWVTHPDDADMAQHLAASQAWPVTIRVFRRAQIVVNLRDAATGALVTEPAEVRVSTPAPDSLASLKTGSTGTFFWNEIGGRPILPSASNFRVNASADCYVPGEMERAVPNGYPANLTEVFDFSLQRIVSGYLHVVVHDNKTGAPIPGADVRVSGGQADVSGLVRATDANGFVRFCVPPSGSVSYVVSATAPGYGAGSLLAVIERDRVTSLTMSLVESKTGNIRLDAGGSRRLVRLRALVGTYDFSQATNDFGYADFTNLAAGDYVAYIATGFDGGEPVWSAGKVVKAQANKSLTYKIP